MSKMPDEFVLAPAINTLIDLKDILGGNVPTWSGLLFMLMFVRPGITQRELCEWAGLSKFACSRAVRAFEARGLVVAERSGKDKVLHLSPGGNALGRTLVARNRAALRRVALAQR